MSTWNNPEELITLAEESTSPPLPPEGGIPPQKIPGWIRWPIRAVILPFVIIDIAAHRIARLFFKTPYKQMGGCTQRGNCCYYVLLPAPDTFLNKIFYIWHTEINGFFARDPKPLKVDEDEFMVMGCRYLGANGRCGHYHMRPALCRNWPQIEYFGRPRILKGCGFKAVPRDKNFDPFPQDEKVSKKPKKLFVLK